MEFKFTKPEARQNFNKITPRKILAVWLMLSLILTIIAPKIFDLKEYKTDQILFATLFLSFFIILIVVLFVKILKRSNK
ncbi:MAG: hypothetical protein EBR80_02770 [Proteobacteria bacterium]|nr:hypothetical protein [Candidatus Fonsibacter lacus]